MAGLRPDFNIRKVRRQLTLSWVAKLFMLRGIKMSVTVPFSVPVKSRGPTPMISKVWSPMWSERPTYVGIAAEAVIPVVPGEDRIGGDTGGAVIGGREQAAERRLKAEEREHVAGGINDVGLLHVVVGGPGDVCAVGVADGDEVGLVLDGVAHEVEVRRGPVVVLGRLAVEAGHHAGEDVELAGTGNGQRAPEQGVDKTEGGDTGADAEGERKHSGRGRDLVRQSWRQRLTSARSDSTHSAARTLWLASRWRSIEPKVRRASSGSRPEAMASSICDCNSSSISRFKRSPCKAFEIRDHTDISGLPEYPVDCQTD